MEIRSLEKLNLNYVYAWSRWAGGFRWICTDCQAVWTLHETTQDSVSATGVHEVAVHPGNQLTWGEEHTCTKCGCRWVAVAASEAVPTPWLADDPPNVSAAHTMEQ